MAKLTQVTINEFLKLAENIPILDARSEGEFSQGHFHNAISFPILNDEERALVGTCYKRKGHEKAVILGYELAGPKFHLLLANAYKRFPDRKVLVHCFRGGLRSRILSYLLHSAGFDVSVLVGGYKVYRKYVLSILQTDLNLKVIGGYTGSGKSDILRNLEQEGKQTIDIEALVNHRGSAFGSIGMPAQPTQEQFENELAFHISKLNVKQEVWIEDESRLTGSLKTPDHLYEQMRNSILYFVCKSREERASYILDTYGKFDKNSLIESTQKLRKRLGDLRMRQAIEHLENGEMHEWLKIVLEYYDKTYEYGSGLRDQNKVIKVDAGLNVIQ